MSGPPAPDEKRVFLDANILYSAAIGGGCVRLWTVPSIRLVTNEYAAAEAWVCLDGEADPARCRCTLTDLLAGLELVPTVDGELMFTAWTLRDPADIPILVGAIESNCQFLLTADARCFGEYFGHTLDGVTIMQVGKFLQMLGMPRPPRQP